MYLLGILNSSLSKFQLKNICDKVQGGFYRLKIIYIKQLSIKEIKNKKDTEVHDEIIKHVNTMLDLNKQKQTITNSETLELINQRIAYTDDKINKLVYELYELTDEEINIVNGN